MSSPTGNHQTPESPRRSRLEDQVLEILNKPPEPIPFKDRARAKMRAQRSRRPRISTRMANQYKLWGSGTFLVGFIALTLSTVLIDDFSPLLARFVALLAIASLVMVWVRRRRTDLSPSEKLWRGRPIDLPGSSNSPLDRLRERFRR